MWITPTKLQDAQITLAQHDIVEMLNRLGREGMDPRIVLAGLAAATAGLLVSVFGSTAVAPWFEGQALIVRDLQKSGN